jgi:hypothetical protein
MMRAVARSQGAESAIKSPKDDMRSAPNRKHQLHYHTSSNHSPRARA